jgi:hypothetical protein
MKRRARTPLSQHHLRTECNTVSRGRCTLAVRTRFRTQIVHLQHRRRPSTTEYNDDDDGNNNDRDVFLIIIIIITAVFNVALVVAGRSAPVKRGARSDPDIAVMLNIIIKDNTRFSRSTLRPTRGPTYQLSSFRGRAPIVVSSIVTLCITCVYSTKSLSYGRARLFQLHVIDTLWPPRARNTYVRVNPVVLLFKRLGAINTRRETKKKKKVPSGLSLCVRYARRRFSRNRVFISIRIYALRLR